MESIKTTAHFKKKNINPRSMHSPKKTVKEKKTKFHSINQCPLFHPCSFSPFWRVAWISSSQDQKLEQTIHLDSMITWIMTKNDDDPQDPKKYWWELSWICMESLWHIIDIMIIPKNLSLGSLTPGTNQAVVSSLSTQGTWKNVHDHLTFKNAYPVETSEDRFVTMCLWRLMWFRFDEIRFGLDSDLVVWSG